MDSDTSMHVRDVLLIGISVPLPSYLKQVLELELLLLLLLLLMLLLLMLLLLLLLLMLLLLWILLVLAVVPVYTPIFCGVTHLSHIQQALNGLYGLLDGGALSNRAPFTDPNRGAKVKKLVTGTICNILCVGSLARSSMRWM